VETPPLRVTWISFLAQGGGWSNAYVEIAIGGINAALLEQGVDAVFDAGAIGGARSVSSCSGVESLRSEPTVFVRPEALLKNRL